MSKSPTPPDINRLRVLPPREAITEMLRWWPSLDDAVTSIKRWLPDGTGLDCRGVSAWRQRGVPRARQLCLIRALEEDFDVQLTFDDVERLTADRVAEPASRRARKSAA